MTLIRKGRYAPCGNCGKEIYIHPHRDRPGSKKGLRKYCSIPCQRIAQNGSADPVEAFWLKVDKSASERGCWLYTGFIKWDGYGWLARKQNGRIRYMTAHRYAWMLTNGEPANGEHILHLCDVQACCNPSHLRLGTHADNMADMTVKGRHNNGRLKKHKPVLYPDRVRPVRKEKETV